jgi:tetratricopeptide (TPR) repeat protein
MQREREQKELQRKRRRRRAIITGVTVVFLGASAWAVYFHGIPAYNYYRANELIESGEYTRAKEMFLALEDYRDAADMVFQSDYLRAGDTRKTGTLTSLKAAQDIYESIPDYKDSARLALRMRYERAELLRNGAEYEQAIALYEELGDYDGAAQQALLARYQWANTLMDELDYSGARAMFLALGSYSDASRLAEECLYLPANRYLEQNEFAKAQALFEQMSDQERAQPRLKELYYRWGDALFGEKRFDEAAEKYILAGDYLDSSRKAALCLYEPAQLLMKEEKSLILKTPRNWPSRLLSCWAAKPRAPDATKRPSACFVKRPLWPLPWPPSVKLPTCGLRSWKGRGIRRRLPSSTARPRDTRTRPIRCFACAMPWGSRLPTRGILPARLRYSRGWAIMKPAAKKRSAPGITWPLPALKRAAMRRPSPILNSFPGIPRARIT